MWMGRESTGQQSGDSQFIGIDEKTPDLAEMQPGYLRKAQNVRIDNTGLGTRGGLFYPQSLNSVSFGTIYGRGTYTDGNGIRWVLLAVNSGVWGVADGQSPFFVPMPGSQTISSFCEMRQAYDVVLLMLGPNAAPLYWDTIIGHSWAVLPAPGSGYVTLPNASTAEFTSDRIVVPYSIDSIAVSKIGDYTSYSNNFNQFNINQGEDDFLVRVFPWMQASVLFFKSHNIYLAQNFNGDLTQMILNEVTSGIGLVGLHAAVQVGNDLFFMDWAGIYRMQQIFSETPEARALPISEPLLQTLRSINWQFASGICAATRKNRVYFAVPIQPSTRNNALLVYNISNEAWESVDTFPNNPNFGIDDLVDADYNGERRILAIDKVNGALYFLESTGHTDLFGTTGASESQIYTWVQSRGYVGAGLRSNYRHVQVAISTWNPSYSINVYGSGEDYEENLCTNKTRSQTTYYTFGKPAWNPSNINGDWASPNRQDYSVVGPIYGTGIIPDQPQESQERYALRVPSRYAQVEVINTQGSMNIQSIAFESWEDQRQDRGQN